MVSASTSGELKLLAWQEDVPILLCEIKLPGNPVAELKFASGDSTLIVRCERERGLRAIDIQALRGVFREFGVDW